MPHFSLKSLFFSKNKNHQVKRDEKYGECKERKVSLLRIRDQSLEIQEGFERFPGEMPEGPIRREPLRYRRFPPGVGPDIRQKRKIRRGHGSKLSGKGFPP